MKVTNISESFTVLKISVRDMQKARKVNINNEMIESVNLLIRSASIIELIRTKKTKG